MKVVEYITENWDSLPKSSFNDYEVVIFKEMDNWDGGYGHHGYAGYGVDESGKVLYCYSSGCSCGGTASYDEQDIDILKKDVKVLEVLSNDMDIFDPKDIDFGGLEVHYSDY